MNLRLCYFPGQTNGFAPHIELNPSACLTSKAPYNLHLHVPHFSPTSSSLSFLPAHHIMTSSAFLPRLDYGQHATTSGPLHRLLCLLRMFIKFLHSILCLKVRATWYLLSFVFCRAFIITWHYVIDVFFFNVYLPYQAVSSIGTLTFHLLSK